ncbi:MAG: hypothetical protein NC912_02840 [Candidatus Omnitrophica bacterium]|nr:hypothetical protein [Candidatus Omnitrophota bacterium]
MFLIPKVVFNLVFRAVWGLRVYNQHDIPRKKGFILLWENSHLLECLALEAALPLRIYWAVADLGSKPSILRWLLLRLGCYPLDPETPDIKGFRLAFKVLKKESVTVFYPGYLSKGFALFCLRSGKDILPVVIHRQKQRPYFKVLFGRAYNFKANQIGPVTLKGIEEIILKMKGSLNGLKAYV